MVDHPRARPKRPVLVGGPDVTDGGDEYRIVTCRVVRVTRNAILLQPKAVQVWVPRSLLHAKDDLAVANAQWGKERTFRLRAWKAEEIGLA